MSKILLVEDEGILAILLEKQLFRMGFTVTAKVDTGEEAVREAKENRPDVILMDIKLNGDIDGIDAMLQIRETDTIPVIYITGNNDPQTRSRAGKTDPVDFLIKPIDPGTLKRAIRSALEYSSQ